MVNNSKRNDRTPSVVPEVVITEQSDSNVSEDATVSREPSRERSSRSISISCLKAGDPLRKEMMFIREKSPFEIGENRDVQLASSKAIIDKALIMDVSGGITKVDEYVSLFFSPGCVIDAAACEDISIQQTIEIVVIEEDDEKPIVMITPLVLEEDPEESQQLEVAIEEDTLKDLICTEGQLSTESTYTQSTNELVEENNVKSEGAETIDQNLSMTENSKLNDASNNELSAETEGKKNGEEEEEEEEEEEDDDDEEEQDEEEETESSSDESYEELVDPSLWRAYNPDGDDPTAWFYKPPEEITPELTEKEKDEEFRRARLAKRVPVFLTNLTDRAGPYGSEIKLQCSVEGLETTCKWLKNEQLVERTSKLQTTTADGLYTLILKDVQKSDQGVYTIIAKNRGGEVSSSARVKVYEDPRDQVELPTIIKIRDYFHHALNDLIIECQIMSKPSWCIPEVAWFKGEDLVQLDHRVRSSYEGNELFQLNIYNPTSDDSGVYTCVAQNSSGEQKITHEVDFTAKVHYIHLPGMHHADRKILTEEELLIKQEQEAIQAQERATARVTSRAEPPPEPYKEESYVIRDSKNKLTWAGQLHNITAQKSQTVKMICSINGNQAIIKWQKNKKAIEFNDRVKLANSGVIGQIVINHVAVKDAGEYVCSAKNNYNEIQTTCILKVIELATTETSPPTFTKAIKEFYDLRTSDLVLETQVHGVPNPEIQWYKNDEKITYDEKLMLNREPNGKYQLRIHKPHSEDCGLYECRANNSDGQSKVKHEVDFNSNEQFVHAHRVEHAERFKRQLEEELAFSPPPNISQETSPKVFENDKVDSAKDKENQDSVAEDTEQDKGDTIDAQSPDQEVVKEPEAAKPKSIFKTKAMPRRRFDDGPSKPFIIRDSKKKLTWETNLKNLTAQEGGTLKLVCIVAGPQPQYKWIKNGKPLVWNKDLVNATKAEFGCVKINNVTLSDAGEYKAQVKNADSEIECTCIVTIFPRTKEVHTKPTFSRITDYYDIRVNDLILEVHVRGIPTPTLLWERDGREFKNGMDRVIISREKDGVYKLSIHDPVKLDGGHWVITAKNEAGEEKVKHQVIFEGQEHVKHVAGIYHADSKLMRDENNEFSIPLRSRPVSRAASIVSMKSQSGEHSIPITEEALNAASTEEMFQDEGNAEVQVENTRNKPQKREWRKKLSTLYGTESSPEERTKPKPLDLKQKLCFEAHLKNLTVAEGSSIKLVCSCVGPSPTIKWFKNNIPLSYSKTLKNNSKLGVGAIQFTTTTVGDTGMYKCVASNNFGEVETTCLLTVYPLLDKQHEAPTFVKNVREYYDIQINDLILEVQVRGNPPPVIKWFRDGIELDDTEGDKFFQLREPEGIHKLTIHDPQIKDQGRYMCEATNIAGKDSIKHELRKFNKEDYTHVYGISHHDPTVMKHGVYEEAEEVVEREHREVIFLEDGTYYMRGQTPEHLWEFETDTSAESEYEPYEPTTEDEKEENVEEEDDDKEKEVGNENDEDKKDDSNQQEKYMEEVETGDKAEADDEDEEELIPQEEPAPAVKRGPKIKKMRKKNLHKKKQSSEPKLPEQQHLINGPSQATETQIKEEEKTIPQHEQSVKPISGEEQVSLQQSESIPIQTSSTKDKDTLRKERYFRLFPQLVPVTPKPEESKNALKFITELRDITISDGKPAKFFCTVLGPKPDIKWLKDGEPMEFTKSIKNQSHDGTGTVTFAKVSPSDSGVYTVVVKNKENVITTQAKLIVVQKPEIRLGMGPRFITNIDQHYDFRVDDLILETHIKGDGLLMVQWFLDGIAIENNDKYIQIREPMGVYKLCIHNPQARDNGNYTIKVTNDFGTIDQKYRMQFEGKTGKPSYGIFHADPRRQYAEEDIIKVPRQHREVVFLEDGTYYVRGQTPEQFWEWETDTSAESEYEEYVSEGEHDIVTEDGEKEDETEVTEDPNVDSITVEEEAIPTIIQNPDDEEEITGADNYVQQEMPKVVKRGPKIKSLRKKIIKSASEIAVVPAAQLKVAVKPGARLGEDGQLKLRLSQRIVSGQTQEAQVSPKPKKRQIEVEFISHLRNQTLLKGKTLSLNCCCSDNQKVQVDWLKDGQKFELDKRCVSDVHFGFITLEIYRTTLEDSGIYECYVKTANGEAKDSCKITVFELPDKELVELVPPTFIHPLKESYHPTTNDLHLETRVRGNPVPTLTWYCDAIIIPHSTEKYEIFNQHYYELGTKITNATLIINNPQMKDSGKYTLVAKNEVEKVTVTRVVKIGLRSEAHKKKRMDDVVIQNEAPRINPKPPTPEPEPEPEPEPVINEEETQECDYTPEEEDAVEEDE